MGRRASSMSSISISSASETSVSSGDSEIDWPFCIRLDTLSHSELRETAYEIFFMCSRSSSPAFGISGGIRGGGVTIEGSEEMVEVPPSPTPPAVVGPKGGTGMMVVTSRVKNSLGLKSRRAPPMRRMNTMGLTSVAAGSLSSLTNSPGRNTLPSSLGKIKRPMTSAEIMRQQLRVTNQSDESLRKILTRSFVGQNGRRADTIVLPLELLRHLKPSDFSDSHEYHQWQRRQLKVLELGLLIHPSLPLDRLNAAALRFREVLRHTETKPIDNGKNSEVMRSLSSAVTALACRSSSSCSAESCHWADGFPLNVHLYLALLQAIFDLRDETTVLDEIDELLELMKKTWSILGINRMIHNVCFAWVLFQQYVATGQVEPDLIKATLRMVAQVANDAKQAAEHEPSYLKVLNGVLASMMGWGEKRLLDYHENFNKGTTSNMENILCLVLLTAKIIAEDLPGMAGATPGLLDWEAAAWSAANRVEYYIHKSMRNAFTKVFETGHGHVDSMIVEVDEDPGDILIQLAEDTEALAAAERETFSPVLRHWFPAAAELALVTLHNCFGIVLKQYLAKTNGLNNEVVRVLQCAGRLEKLLMQMATDEAADGDDGDKSLLKQMAPYEVDTITTGLLKTWIDERLRMGRECLNRAKETESWMPKIKGEPFAQSAVDLMKLAKVTVDEFFEIPMTARDEMVQDLAEGLETIFQEYTNFAASCGTQQSYLPLLPPLTRCNQDPQLVKLWKKAASTDIQLRGVGCAGSTPDAEAAGKLVREPHHHHPKPSTSRGTQRLYIRINTLHYLDSHIRSLDKSLAFFSRDGFALINHPSPSSPAMRHHNQQPHAKHHHLTTAAAHFDLIRASIQSAVLHVSEVTAYRLIFLDSADSLYDSLYIGGVAGSRIRPSLLVLKQNLNMLLTALTDRAQPIAVKEVMRATFEAFLMVLLAGGPKRAFDRTDHEMLIEDFKNMKTAFSVEGLVAEEVVDREAKMVEGIIGLMSLPTERLIEDFNIAARKSNAINGPAQWERPTIPPTTGRWGRSDPNSMLRVLCHRNDDAANNFLRKAFQLPKRS